LSRPTKGFGGAFKTRERNLSGEKVWCYSGYLFDQDILAGKLGDLDITKEMLGYLDVLVDGRIPHSRKRFKSAF